MDLWLKLVELLSRCTVSEAIADEGRAIVAQLGIGSYSEAINLPNYPATWAEVNDLKRKIELIHEANYPREREISRALVSLVDEVRSKAPATRRVDAIQSFIRGSVYRRWDPNQRALFDHRARIITSWIDFFVSYTNRDACETNTRFARLIKVALGPRPAKERQTVNFVARVIARYLEANNLRGFTDYENIKCGDELEESIHHHVQKAFALVQFLEHESFREPTSAGRNWCHEEYQSFCRRLSALQMPLPGEEKIFFLISTEKLEGLRPANLGPYHDWFQYVDRIRYVSLDGMDFKQLRAEIQKIAGSILEHKKKIVDALIADPG